MTAKPIHSMIRVLDEARSVTFYRTAFGLDVADRFAFDGFTLIYLRNATSSFEVELTVNTGRTKPYELGDGYGHLAVAVDDVDAEHARVTAAGLAPTPLRSMEHAGKPLARFFFLQDPDGYRIEVLQRGGRYA
jgi:lactoylglutathione lyase